MRVNPRCLARRNADWFTLCLRCRSLKQDASTIPNEGGMGWAEAKIDATNEDMLKATVTYMNGDI